MADKITFEYLEKLYHKNEKRLRLGKKMTDLEAWLTAAAGHAIDVIEISNRAKNARLDLTLDTRDHLPMALMLCGMSAIKSGKTDEEEWFSYMIKKAAACELFIMYNMMLDIENIYCEIQLPKGSNELILYAKNNESGSEATINFFDAFRRMQEEQPVFVFSTSGEVGVYQGLASSLVSKEFLAPLGFSAAAE